MSMWRRRGDSNRSDVAARIRETLATLGPMLHLSSAAVELVSYQAATGVAVLRFEGDCPDCEMSALTLRQAVEAHLRTKIPELREIRALGDAQERASE
jgi:Fe-S cluster biogenesis protein NfuA